MRRFQRILLWLITAIIPVTIAACYGDYMEYSRTGGRVQDAESQAGIPGIACTCLIGGYEQDMVYSDADGRFDLYSGGRCEQILFEDVDGESNGGLYLRRTISLIGSEDCEDITVSLRHQD